MMGPWTILGNHLFGGTIFLYDGAPDYPSPARLWETIERHRITTFGVSPTAIRMLSKSAGELPPMESLRILGSTGEPWDDTSWLWFFERVGRRRCPIINISGGTEIVGSFLFPLPIQPLKPCTLGGPAPGMATEVVDENGVPVRGRKGYLVCTGPAPSMTRGIWGDAERYLETYWSRFPGMWYHGDWASVDEDGYWFLHGRADESMNVAGRKVGPAEVEEAMMQHPGVAEAAVIGVPDESQRRGDCRLRRVQARRAGGPGGGVADRGRGARSHVSPEGNRGGGGVAEDAERKNRAPPASSEISRRRTGRSFHGGEPWRAVMRVTFPARSCPYIACGRSRGLSAHDRVPAASHRPEDPAPDGPQRKV